VVNQAAPFTICLVPKNACDDQQSDRVPAWSGFEQPVDRRNGALLTDLSPLILGPRRFGLSCRNCRCSNVFYTHDARRRDR
jgi:hypothetical protein